MRGEKKKQTLSVQSTECLSQLRKPVKGGDQAPQVAPRASHILKSSWGLGLFITKEYVNLKDLAHFSWSMEHKHVSVSARHDILSQEKLSDMPKDVRVSGWVNRPPNLCPKFKNCQFTHTMTTLAASLPSLSSPSLPTPSLFSLSHTYTTDHLSASQKSA